MILSQTVHEIYSSEAVRGVIFGPFPSVDNFRPKVPSDVISDAFVDPSDVKVRVKFGDPRSNRSPDMRLPHFVRTTTTMTTTTAYAGHHNGVLPKK